MSQSFVESVWYGRTVAGKTVGWLLTPFSWLFRAGVAVRNWAYDRGLARTIPSAIPVISVGNLTVGGTGKTPLVAWLANEWERRGEKPAIVLRGYGDDEPKVHALLAPGVPVHVSPDRASGIAQAAREGATVAILDDAMQHRRAQRTRDIVLLSADRWMAPRLLPAGPFREPLGALRRASLVVITVKSTDAEAKIDLIQRAVRRIAPTLPIVVVFLRPKALVDIKNPQKKLPLDILHGAPVLAIAGIGDPDAFFSQLTGLGGKLTKRVYRDHYAYTPNDVAELGQLARDHKYSVTTLKDAVKLAGLWPEKGLTLWYVSQAVTVDDKCSSIEQTIFADIRSAS